MFNRKPKRIYENKKKRERSIEPGEKELNKVYIICDKSQHTIKEKKKSSIKQTHGTIIQNLESYLLQITKDFELSNAIFSFKVFLS